MKRKLKIVILTLQIKRCKLAIAFWDRVLAVNRAITGALTRLGA